jgi:hypothetical protein
VVEVEPAPVARALAALQGGLVRRRVFFWPPERIARLQWTRGGEELTLTRERDAWAVARAGRPPGRGELAAVDAALRELLAVEVLAWELDPRVDVSVEGGERLLVVGPDGERVELRLAGDAARERRFARSTSAPLPFWLDGARVQSILVALDRAAGP